MCTCETMRFALHRISRWFDRGYCVILSRSVNRRVKASQAQARLHHSNWHLEQSSPGLHSFKLYGSLLKPTERSPNPPRMEKGRWIAIEGKRKGAWVWKRVCVLGGIQYCRLGVNGLGLLDCKLWWLSASYECAQAEFRRNNSAGKCKLTIV